MPYLLSVVKVTATKKIIIMKALALQTLIQLFTTGFATIVYRSTVKTSAKSPLNGLIAKVSKQQVYPANYYEVKQREEANGNEKYITPETSRPSKYTKIGNNVYQHENGNVALRCFTLKTLESKYINTQTGEQMTWEEVKQHLTPGAVRASERARTEKKARMEGEAVRLPQRTYNLSNVLEFHGMGLSVKVK
jgi:hypothetical protein